MRIALAFCLFVGLPASSAEAIVVRHDREDSRYRELAAGYPMVCRVGGGMGTLIAPQWVVTAGHVAEQMLGGGVVYFGERAVPVAAAYLHPDFAKPDDHRDLGLVELAEPVDDISTAVLHGDGDELGQTVLFVGDGRSGTGLTGPRDGERFMRGAHNTVTEVKPGWVNFAFDAPPDGDDLEGISGPGDSGGPALVEVEGVMHVIGVSAYNDGGELCTYGTTEHYGRISDERVWLDGVMDGSIKSSGEQRMLRHGVNADGEATVSSEEVQAVVPAPALAGATDRVAQALNVAFNSGDQESFRGILSESYLRSEGDSSIAGMFTFMVDARRIHGDIASMHPVASRALSISDTEAPMMTVVWHFADGYPGYYGIALDDENRIVHFSLFVRKDICRDAAECKLTMPIDDR